MNTFAPIVFAPGAGENASIWGDQVRAFPGGQMKVVDYTDLDSIPAMASRVLENAPDRFALYSTSMGGYVALEVARRAPERITKLMLAHTNARADSPEATRQREDKIAAGAQVFYDTLGNAERYADTLSPVNANNRELIDRLHDMHLQTGFDCYVRHNIACMNRPSALDVLPGLTMPVMVISGKDDKKIPPMYQQEIAALTPNALLHVIEDCGHMAHLERPEMVTRLVNRFVFPPADKKFAVERAVPA